MVLKPCSNRWCAPSVVLQGRSAAGVSEEESDVEFMQCLGRAFAAQVLTKL